MVADFSQIAQTYRDGRRIVAEGICLKRIDYGNSSQIVSFLAPDSGRTDCMYKGAWRSPGKGISYGVDLAGRYRIDYRQGRSSGLDTLQGCSMLEHFSGLRFSVERAICGFYAIELMLNFTAHDQDCRELYAFLLAALRRFASGESLGMGVLELEFAVLEHHGSRPDFAFCALCHCEPGQVGVSCFSAQHGGYLCVKCGGDVFNDKSFPYYPLREDTVLLLARICRGEAVTGISEKPAGIVAASKVLRHHIKWLLGRELRMWKYLHDRHYSRSLADIRAHRSRTPGNR